MQEGAAVHMKAIETQNIWGREETVLMEDQGHRGLPGGKGEQQQGRDCTSAKSLTCRLSPSHI